MIDKAVAGGQPRPPSLERHAPFRQSLQAIRGKKRFGSVVIYTTGALAMAVFFSVVFNVMGHDTEFAIAIMGSLIGGFLGAMLAAALVIDVYSRSEERDRE